MALLPVESKNADCSLKCLNGGTCRRRLDGTPEAPTPDDAAPPKKRGSYCQCPFGFSGALCEIKFETCTSKDEQCRNGSQCQRQVDWDGNEFFHCECDLKQSDLTASPVAAKVCEKASTVFCKINAIQTDAKKKKKDKHHSVSDTAGSSYCYNNGRCKPQTDKHRHHAGCECVDGYSGVHCEVSSVPTKLAKAKMAPQPTWTPRQRRILSVISFIGIMLLFLMAGVAYLVYHGNRNRPARSAFRPPTRQYKTTSARERARIPREVPISEIEVV